MESEIDNLADSADKWKYVIVISKFAIHLLEASISKSFGVLIPGMVILFDTRLSVLGLLCSFPVTWLLVTCPLVAHLLKYDAVNRRGIAVLGALISSGALIASAYTRNVLVLGIALAFNGLGMGLNFMPTLVLLNEFFPKRFVLMSTVTLFGSIIGILFVPLMTERCFRAYGYSGAMLILGGLMLHTVAGGVAIRKPRDAKANKGNTKEVLASVEHTEATIESKIGVDIGDDSCTDDYKMLEHLPTYAEHHQKMNDLVSCRNKHSPEDHIDVQLEPDWDPHHLMQAASQESRSVEDTYKDLAGPCEDHTLIQSNSINDSLTESLGELGVKLSWFQRLCQWLRTGIFLQDYLFTLTLPTHLLIQYGAYAWMLFLVPRAEWLGVTSDKAVLLSTIGGIGALVGRIILFIPLYYEINEFHICLVSSSIAALTFLVDSLVTSFYAMCIVAFIQGWVIFTNTAIPPAFCKSTTSPSNFGLGCGYSALVGGLGGNIGGLLSGVIFDTTHSYTAVFLSIGGIHCLIVFNVIVYLIVLYRIKNSKNKNHNE